MNMSQPIPRISLAPMLNAPESGILEIAEQVRDTYTSVGFAYLVNHGISEMLIEGVFRAAQQFHDLPLDQKLKIRQNKFFRGFMPQSSSRFELSTLGKAIKPNQSEAFIIANEVPKDHPDYRAEQFLAGPNQWPTNLPGFRSAVMAYYKAMHSLATCMVQIFAVAFKLAPNGLDEFFQSPNVMTSLSIRNQ